MTGRRLRPRYVPELSDVASPAVPQPRRLGHGGPTRYPMPIVDLADARARFLSTRGAQRATRTTGSRSGLQDYRTWRPTLAGEWPTAQV